MCRQHDKPETEHEEGKRRHEKIEAGREAQHAQEEKKNEQSARMERQKQLNWLTDWLHGNGMGEWQISNWNIKRRREGGEHGKAKWNEREGAAGQTEYGNIEEKGTQKQIQINMRIEIEWSTWLDDWNGVWLKEAWGISQCWEREVGRGSHVVSKGKEVGRSAGEGKKNECRKTRNIASYGREFRNERENDNLQVE